MYAVTFTFPGDEVEQIARILFGLEDIADECLDPDVPDSAGADIVDDFREIVEETIEDGGRNGRFKPLSPRYAAKKPEGAPILVFTGGMRKALTQPRGQNLTRFSNGVLTLGAKPGSRAHKLATYHQGGTPRMPARPPVQLTDDDKQRWIRFINAMVRRRAGRLAT